MLKNAKVFLMDCSGMTAQMRADMLQEALEPHQAGPTMAMEVVSMGWVPPVKDGALAHLVGEHILLSLRTTKKLIPSKVVAKAAAVRADEIEREQGFKPGRKQMREIKEKVMDTLLPTALSVDTDTRVWIDIGANRLIIDTSSDARADEALQMLNRAVERMPLANLHLEMAPATAMTEWIARDEAPPNFTIDTDTEFRSSGEGRASVRYVRQSVEADQARAHIEAGKQVTRLAMTWADRISFVLTEGMTLARITPLDVIKAEGEEAERGFDGEFLLLAGECRKLIDDLVDAMGGLKQD